MPIKINSAGGGSSTIDIGSTGNIYTVTLPNSSGTVALNYVINVKSYGAVGDGSADDTSAITSAISVLNSTGGSLYFPKGTYRISGALPSITVSGCKVYGDGRGGTVIANSSASGNSITLSEYSITIEDIKFQPTVARNSNVYELDISSASWAVIRNIFINGGDTNKYVNCGIHIYNSSTCWLENINLRGLSGAYGIYIGGSAGNGSYGCYVKGVVADVGSITATTWITLDSYAYSPSLMQCALLNGAYGIRMIDSANTGSSYPQFLWGIDIECDHNNYCGLSIEKGVSVYIGTSWIGSCLSGNGIAFGTGFLGDASISNTRIMGNYQHGVLINGGTDVNIIGCTVTNNSTASSGTYHNITVASSITRFMISNCRTGTIAPFASSNSGYGIAINSSCDYFSVTGNLGYGNATGNISNASGTGTNKIVANNN